MADRKKPGKTASSSTTKNKPKSPGERSHEAEHEDTVRKGYDAAQDPEAQGDGDPGVDQITETRDNG